MSELVLSERKKLESKIAGLRSAIAILGKDNEQVPVLIEQLTLAETELATLPEEIVEQKVGPLQEKEQEIITLLSEYSAAVSENNVQYKSIPDPDNKEKWCTARICSLLREIDRIHCNHNNKSFQVDILNHLWTKITIRDVYDIPEESLQGYINVHGATDNDLREGVKIAQAMLDFKAAGMDDATIDAVLASMQISIEDIRKLFGEHYFTTAKLRILDEESPFITQILEELHIPSDENFIAALRKIIKDGLILIAPNTIRHRYQPPQLEEAEHKIFFAYEDLFTLRQALIDAGLPLDSDAPQGFSYSNQALIKM